jgi:hypothetical protein
MAAESLGGKPKQSILLVEQRGEWLGTRLNELRNVPGRRPGIQGRDIEGSQTCVANRRSISRSVEVRWLIGQIEGAQPCQVG